MKKLLLVLIVLSFASVFIGVADLSLSAIFRGDTEALELLAVSRLPRLLAILLSGAGLSIAGLIMQQISQNRFAAPSTSGTIECAMLGYVLSLVIFGHGDNLLLIFAMAIGGTLLFIQFIHRIQFKNAIYVPLIGIIFGNVVSSAATFVAYKYDAVQNLSAWTVANFANILQGNYELLYIAVPISVISYWYATRLSAVGMGKDFATNIGLKYKQILFLGIILVSVMSATVVMIVGQLPFLGLIVPNLVAQFYGDNLRRNIPLTAIVGAILILVCDVVGRVIIFPYEIPISMIISILGGMVFIFFIVKGKQNV
ncbi:iron chelate uptake ABC transporter permease subunit VctD [Aliivibrio sp. S4TY2]|uniref:iron chelate uptake ABC transporter permease subunit VctD n=1 Tax=unclassified Aliivibrio TaxID=2645654 RepID=UPI002378E944|nr:MULTISPECIES: iron chelate uptake ABC transporter permease subunit VctD [unclassified Aliivibrio]MDD9156246.1 iron chelate uptake ABC transporter permease subunit VctD [Aliivibrio sp. S4TY2]MDD9160593.1 iron chelate uptake ABC transporter permease subunit VctD [Aliivibrio sp. S4TY1]MDD9163953.1 iron chelate uptake ABC transporter permease subunit VctD [Aliivibrio sp. S4MY2]MDD9168072.1 iron chelate uptake ABC transporter permease subunit VctD [Aliivibrio sp. S4MY4]MDD9185150.1 iron chelate 